MVVLVEELGGVEAMGKNFVLIIAVICAAIASIFIYRILKEGSEPKIIEPPMTQTVVAKTTIPAGAIIDAAQLEVKLIPQEAVNQDSARKLQDVVGLTAKAEIMLGEQVNLNRLFRKGDPVGLAFLIPSGLRAITIPVNEVLGVAGFIKPGTRVDLIEILHPKDDGQGITWTLYQDIEVLAVSQDMGYPNRDSPGSANQATNEAKIGASVTLAVTPLQAQKIVLAVEKGVLHLALRPILQEKEQAIPVIRENNLLPGGKSIPSSPKPQSSKRIIEIISGGKSTFITID